MKKEIIKGIVSSVLTLLIVILGGLNSPLESYTNTTTLLFSNKELLMVLLIFVVFILKNTKMSAMIYSSRSVSPAYLFFFANNVCINLMLILTLLETNKISLLVGALLTIGEFIISMTQLIGGGYLSEVDFNSRNVGIKEFLSLVTIVALILGGMPFALISWPIAQILLIVYVLHVVNLAFNNLLVVTKEM